MPDEAEGFPADLARAGESIWARKGEPVTVTHGEPLVLPADEFAAVQKLQARLDELENAVSWNTSCLGCAAVLDSSIREHVRAERAEEALEGVKADVRWILPGLVPLHEGGAMPPKTKAAYERLCAAVESLPVAPKPALEPGPPKEPSFDIPPEGAK